MPHARFATLRLLLTTRLRASLAALLGLTALILALGWLREQQPISYRLPLDRQLTIDSRGVGAVEIGERGEFRWFARSSSLLLRSLSPVAHELTLYLHNGAVSRTIDLGWAGQPPFSMTLRPGWQTVTVRLPAAALDASGRSTLQFSIPPLSGDASDRLGLAVAGLTLTQINPAYPNGLISWLCASAVLLIALNAAAGLSLRAGVSATAAGLLGLSTLHWFAPLGLGAVWDELLIALATASVVIAITRRLTAQAWQAAQPYAGRTALAAALLFCWHSVGMQSPAFINIDHILRAHQVITMAQGRAGDVQDSLSMQYEWNMRVPYPLLTYWIFTPFYPFLQTSAAMTALLKWSGSLFHASTMGLLFVLARRYGADNRQAWYSAALFAALPLTHLYMHDGSYPTIIGLWCTVIALIAAERLQHDPSQRRRWWPATALLLALAMLTYVTQAAFIPLLFGAIAVSRFRRDDRTTYTPTVLLLSALAAGGLAALLLYYGQFIWPVLQTLIERFSSGARPGHDESRLPGPLVGPLWLQIWGHTRVIGMILAIAGGWIAVRSGSVHWRAGALATLAFLLITISADTQFSLWHKHWYFALPLLALFGGRALAALSQRGRWGARLSELLLLLLLAESARAWFLRIVFYDWSLWTI